MGTPSLSGSAGEEGMVADRWRWGSGDKGWRNGWVLKSRRRWGVEEGQSVGVIGREGSSGLERQLAPSDDKYMTVVEGEGRQRRTCFEGGEGVIPGRGVGMEET